MVPSLSVCAFAFGLCFRLGSHSPASICGSFLFLARAFVGVSWGFVTCLRCLAGRGPMLSAFAFVFGFWLRSRLCLRYQLLHLFSTRAFVVRRVPSLLLPAARVSAFRLVSLLSACAFAACAFAACAFDLGLCFCTRLVLLHSACAFALGLCLRFSVLVFFRLLTSTFSLDPVFVRHLRFSGLWPRFNIFVSSALDILFYLFFAGYCILRPTVIIWVPVFLIFIYFTSTFYDNPGHDLWGRRVWRSIIAFNSLLALKSIARILPLHCLVLDWVIGSRWSIDAVIGMLCPWIFIQPLSYCGWSRYIKYLVQQKVTSCCCCLSLASCECSCTNKLKQCCS